MKQSEYKNQREKESEQYRLAFEEMKKKPINVTQIRCKNKSFIGHLGGYDDKGRRQICWDCPNCGRVGGDYIESSLLDGDNLIWQNCDLEEG